MQFDEALKKYETVAETTFSFDLLDWREFSSAWPSVGLRRNSFWIYSNLQNEFQFLLFGWKKEKLLTVVIVFVIVSPNSIRHFEIDIDGLRLSLGPSVVEIFFYNRYRYQYDTDAMKSMPTLASVTR